MGIVQACLSKFPSYRDQSYVPMTPCTMKLSYYTIATSLMLCAPCTQAEQAILHIDGRFRVQRGSMDQASVKMIRDGRISNVLTNDIRKVALDLELQAVYTLSFSCPGYLTKDLLFDTRMTSEAVANAPFEFKFDVTLEDLVAENRFAYAGPVGFIRFLGEREDFGYDTNYAFTHMKKSPATIQGEAPEASLTASKGRRERHYVQPFIEPTLAEDLAGLARTAADPRPEEEAQFVINGSPDNEMCEIEAVASNVNGLTNMAAAAASEAKAMKSRKGVDRSVILEQERAIVITRFSSGGKFNELREIKHTDGTIMHFCNASSCSLKEYTELMTK